MPFGSWRSALARLFPTSRTRKVKAGRNKGRPQHPLLERLEVNPESVLVIQGDSLVTRDARLSDTDVIEIRPVTSGGAA